MHLDSDSWDLLDSLGAFSLDFESLDCVSLELLSEWRFRKVSWAGVFEPCLASDDGGDEVGRFLRVSWAGVAEAALGTDEAVLTRRVSWAGVFEVALDREVEPLVLPGSFPFPLPGSLSLGEACLERLFVRLLFLLAFGSLARRAEDERSSEREGEVDSDASVE